MRLPCQYTYPTSPRRSNAVRPIEVIEEETTVDAASAEKCMLRNAQFITRSMSPVKQPLFDRLAMTVFTNNNTKPLWLNQARALIFSLAALSLALGILWFGNSLNRAPGDTLVVREVALVTPPPPPPPPALQRSTLDTPVTLQVQGAGPALKNIEVQQQKIDIQKPDVPNLQNEQPQWQSLEVNWDAFSLDDLDGMPTLLTPLRMTLPKSITRQGVTEVMIAIDIIVYETGRIELIQVTQNPYPELKPEIDKLIRSSRFSPPKMGHKNVRVKFNWPIRIRS